MHYKDEPNAFEDEFNIPANTIETAWRYFQGNPTWCFNNALGGVPFSIRYRNADNRLGIIRTVKDLRQRFYRDHPEYDGRLKICARWPFMLVVMLKEGRDPMPDNWVAVHAPIKDFYQWHHQNFNGSGRHEDPSRPQPTAS
jgi:hypothetical protein